MRDRGVRDGLISCRLRHALISCRLRRSVVGGGGEENFCEAVAGGLRFSGVRRFKGEIRDFVFGSCEENHGDVDVFFFFVAFLGREACGFDEACFLRAVDLFGSDFGFVASGAFFLEALKVKADHFR